MSCDISSAQNEMPGSMPPMMPGMPGGQYGMPQQQPQQGGTPEQMEMVAAAMQDIQAKLPVLLSVVNMGSMLGEDDLAQAQKTVTDNKRFYTRFDNQQKSQFDIFAAWTSYYAGENEKALVYARNALKNDPQSSDAQITHTALAVLGGDYKVLEKLYGLKTSKSSLFGQQGGQDQYSTGYYGSSGGLQFNLQQMKGQMLGEKLGELKLKCINNTYFYHEPNSSVMCVLLWKLSPDETASQSSGSSVSSGGVFGGGMPAGAMPGGMPGMMTPMNVPQQSGQQNDNTVAFGELFRGDALNPQLAFLGVSLDKPANRRAVLNKLLENPWPWAQVMAADNEAISKLAELNIEQPLMVIVDANSNIRYIGPAAGFLPKMLLRHIIKTQNPTGSTAAAAVPESPIMPAGQAAIVQSTPAAPVQKPSPAAKTIDEDFFDPQAEKLLEYADKFLEISNKMVSGRSYKKTVDNCRQVMKDYPNTKYELRAREILRKVPENYRANYNITSEELGL